MTQEHLYEPVIGLEIHVRLKTQSKLFSRAPATFAEKPNSAIGPVDTGAPGSLPILNKEAVVAALRFGAAIGAKINKSSTFDRKSYFYPDSPRNYQITQFETPILEGGQIEVVSEEGLTHCFQIERAHIEDDAGMLKHFSHFAAVDYNRAGMPLLEIVSTPCMHSAKEAAAYAKTIRAILRATNAADCHMEEGGLRFDINVSIRKKGEKELRPRVEIKNMNSFAGLEAAIEAEVARQIAAYSANPDKPYALAIDSGTYRFDAASKKTILMRRKEAAHDYRYFPEPDLPPLVLSQSFIDAIVQTLPELPAAKQKRYIESSHLSPFFAALLTEEPELCHYFEEAQKLAPYPRAVANWMLVEFPGRLKEKGIHNIALSKISPLHLGELVALIEEKVLTGKIAKDVADKMAGAEESFSPKAWILAHPELLPLRDEAALLSLIDGVLADFPESIKDYHAGIEKAFHHLLGQVMKRSKGKADPEKSAELLRKRLS